jgi:L-fucose isomerase-like protein
MKTKIKVIFPGSERGTATWPYINYDVEGRAKQVVDILKKNMPDTEFSSQVIRVRKGKTEKTERVEKIIEAEKGQYDGYLVYMTSMWTGIAEAIAQKGIPLIVADELYAGSGGLLHVKSIARKENLPAVCIGSSDFQDVIKAVNLFSVLKRMKESKILVVADEENWGSKREKSEMLKENFGTDVVRMKSDELKNYYEKTDVKQAEEYKNKWISEAVKVVEPSKEEILKSARMHLALKQAMKDKNADAVTVDCLGLYYSGKLFAYPCLSFFQLNNEGSTGVCEADLDSTITQLLIRYLTGRPAYVSDPVIDTAANQIIYAHCVATNKVYGPQGLANPYIIRSHAEDRKGASVQSLMPLGKKVTTIKVSLKDRALSVHQGKTVANVEDDKGCRTKLAVEVNAEKVFYNYHSEIFSWHRVTFYGDFKKEIVNLAVLLGLKIIEEDK